MYLDSPRSRPVRSLGLHIAVPSAAVERAQPVEEVFELVHLGVREDPVEGDGVI